MGQSRTCGALEGVIIHCRAPTGAYLCYVRPVLLYGLPHSAISYVIDGVTSNPLTKTCSHELAIHRGGQAVRQGTQT
jgi:hypothetical protein